ncbi:hypothetical protein E2A64_05540 [Pseudohoeflea suaedae]|uniref:Uncharacterized protein n=1 Tax=Pseudohoeflea suaedae TaxID=877384 RepID=A0A4R5PND1_9HYPH|nr:hypothetical protein [Pseudohoeflea suaedae]TDH38564.1 hypothetical protein E2A64_05540 [Pseudohoeflea suaedae]
MNPSIKRQMIEDQIEQLIAALDFFDGDPDLEDNGDTEPTLICPPRYINGRLEYDLELDDADNEDAGEDDLPGFIWGGQGA